MLVIPALAATAGCTMLCFAWQPILVHRSCRLLFIALQLQHGPQMAVIGTRVQ